VRPKRQLIRLALAGDRVVVDGSGRLPGRGAYVCSRACAERALRRRVLGRAFRRAVNPDPDLLELLD
jgi:predicted RNA-binding protein YlxR (DUF448 family)